MSLGGEYTNTCYVPQGSVLVLMPGGYGCSEAEGHGSTTEELSRCADENFALLDHVEVTLHGTTATELEDYVVTTRKLVLPPDNLLSPSATATLMKGYFLVLVPLSRGTHTLRAYDEFSSFDFQADITYTIVVR